jgi:SAM-dependent methyltransferase
MNVEAVLQSTFVQKFIKPLFPGGVRRVARRVENLFLSKKEYGDVQWGRVTYIAHWNAFLSSIGTERLSLLEISPGPVSMWRERGWASYTSVQFPEFDIAKDVLPEKFDVVIAEHVFEHLRHPSSAARNIHTMLKESGVFIIATPFLVRVHNEPGDYTRWSEMGLAGLLEDSGFVAETHSWGNEACVVANFSRWELCHKDADLTNDPVMPLVVWAYARQARKPA